KVIPRPRIGSGTSHAPATAACLCLRRTGHDKEDSLMRRRRSVEVFSLSFLGCICCGFGAIILLLVLTEIGRPVVLEKTRQSLDGQIRALTVQLREIRGETDQRTRELQGSRV